MLLRGICASLGYISSLDLAGHPKHPLSGKERFIILTFELLLKLFVAGIFSASGGDEDDQAVINTIQSIIVALFTTVFSALLVFIATCDDRFLGDSIGGALRCLLSSLSAFGLCFAWFFMLVLGITGVVLVATAEDSSFEDYMVVTAQALGWSWFVIWPLVNGLLLFSFGRWREQRKLAKAGLTTQDGIDVETLGWWKTNEFPPDTEVLVSNAVAATALCYQDTLGGAHVAVEVEAMRVAPGGPEAPVVESEAPAAPTAAAPSGASFAMGHTPSPNTY